MSQDVSDLLAKFHLDGQRRKDLAAVGKLAVPLLPEVLEHFYSNVSKVPAMIAFFADDEMIARARKAQEVHWQTLLSGEFSDAYFASAHKIGRIHPRIGLPFEFFLSGYAIASSELQTLILQRHGGGLLRRGGGLAGRLSALTRAFALDTHLILDAHFEAEQEEQNIAFSYLSDGINRLAQRDLTGVIPSPETSDFPARFNEVRQTFNTALTSLQQVMGSIQEATATLTTIAAEVGDAAENLSHRTESQAATLEQTAAAVEQINVSMRSATQATDETSQTVTQSRNKAEEGSNVVRDAVAKMEEIADSSQKIAAIIGVIDDISFQTNLLALNAGVEAARAGDSGRGFAVVASEVRGLAQRTAESADEIKALIQVSTGHVETGVTLVGSAGDALTEILGDIQQAAALTEKVASSSAQQATGFNEINTGVSQLDSVTQQNAAMVEETTAALLSLRNDVNGLSQIAQSFRLSAQSPAAQRRAAG